LIAETFRFASFVIQLMSYISCTCIRPKNKYEIWKLCTDV